jgi:hypothetical protein
MRRTIITWAALGALVIGGFAAVVFALNATLYSPAGFVRGYLDALARHDATGAMALAGGAEGDPSRELLTAAAMSELADIQLVASTDEAGGVTRVTYSYTTGDVAGQTTFDVERRGTLLGLFPTWSFATSPIGVIQLSVLNDREFTANGVALTAPAQNTPTPYLVFTPGTYRFAHDSEFLHADPVPITATRPTGTVTASLAIRPNQAFIDEVQSQVDDYLDETCVPQQVLQPTGCPFGQEISNRTVSEPAWSMTEYPEVSLEPGAEPASWLMPPTPGTAHLVVDVQSLFDGSISTFDEDVPFRASYLVTFLADGQLLITAQN